MKILIGQKIFFLQFFENRLYQWGVGVVTTDLITFLAACLAVVLLLYLFDWLGRKVVTRFIKYISQRTRNQWDSALLEQKFFQRLIHLIMGGVLLSSFKAIFRGYRATIITGGELVIQVYLVVIGALLFSSFMNAVNQIYNSKPIARQKSIKGFIQTAKITFFVICGVFIIAILTRQNPTQLFVGLGASAAIMTLIFKDTILGFVASIQISAQDMIRPGDWIEMPSKGADGVVTDINVSNVKVRNWDNTMTMIPIYSLVSDAFTNWRSMEEGEGRRFKRPLLINTHSVRELSSDEIQQLSSHPYIQPIGDQMLKINTDTNLSPFTTNLGLFRCYVESYLRNHPKVSARQTLAVRYLPISEYGIAMELYGFSTEKNFTLFEPMLCDMINHLIRMAQLFDLEPYQRSATTTPPKM